jgi:hypothetical protein
MPCPSHPLIILGEEYKLCSSSLCSFLEPPVTSSLSGPNILLSSHVRRCTRKETLIKASIRRAEKRQDFWYPVRRLLSYWLF